MEKKTLYCDRCGKEISDKVRINGSGIHIFKRKLFTERTDNTMYDLCDDCYKSLEKWVKKGNKR